MALTNNWAEGIEGLNEPDLNTRSYQGLTDVPSTGNLAATKRYQQGLFNAVQASSAANKPVLSPAVGNPNHAGMLAGSDYDQEAVHYYAGSD